MMYFSRKRNIFIGLSFFLAFTGWGCLLALQPPLYPLIAEQKGASPSQYGFVFGILNLSALIFAPLFGRFGNKIGSTYLYTMGSFSQGVISILFGLLQYVTSTEVFIGLSYGLRFVNGIADAAVWGSSLAILLKMFPDKATTLMSYTEMCLALGYILGPSIGSLLYETGGFMLPYQVVGSILVVSSVCLCFSLPNVDHLTLKDNLSVENKPMKAKDILKNPSLVFPFMDNFLNYASYGMIEAMLEPHMLEIHSSQRDVSYAFLISGAVYFIVAPFTGLVSHFKHLSFQYSLHCFTGM